MKEISETIKMSVSVKKKKYPDRILREGAYLILDKVITWQSGFGLAPSPKFKDRFEAEWLPASA